MKKIGIITMHRIPNFGSFLQTFATQEVLKKLGYSSDIIDYEFPNDWQYEHGTPKYNNFVVGFKQFFVRMILLIFKTDFGNDKISGIATKIKLRKALNKYCKLSNCYFPTYKSIIDNPPHYDIYITGSDQTWNPNHTKQDLNFLLAFAPDNAKKISISASLSTNLLSVRNKELYTNYLSKYSAISIREKNNLELIKRLSGLDDVTVTLDPTLLLSKDEWLSAFVQDKRSYNIPGGDYILLYMLSYSFDPQPYVYELLQYLQNKTGKLILSFTPIDKKYDLNYEYIGGVGVRDFIEIFAHASDVVTSSFHGTAFALNFGKNLYSIVPQNYKEKDSRQTDILESLHAERYLIPMGTEFDKINFSGDKVVVNSVNLGLEVLRISSIKWIKDNIN